MHINIWTYLANSLALHCQGFHLGEVVVIGSHISNNGFLIWLVNINVWKETEWLFASLHLNLFNSSTALKVNTIAIAWTMSLKLTCGSKCYCKNATWVLYPLTFWVQQLGKPQLLLSHIKSILEIVVGIGPFQGVKLNQVRSVRRRAVDISFGTGYKREQNTTT